jgi:hypothetical protein
MTDTQRETMESDLVERLLKRAEIRRQIGTRKSVQEGKPDRIADILEESANKITALEAQVNALREALGMSYRWITDVSTNDEDEVLNAIEEALQSTKPTDALNRFENEVIERCAETALKSANLSYAIFNIRALKKEVK